MSPAREGFVLQVKGLSKIHRRGSGWFARAPGVRAFEDVDFRIPRGAAVAITGPSGAGKSSLARCISLLDTPSGGLVALDGIEVRSAAARRSLLRRGAVQMVFQSAAASLNRRMRVMDVLCEPLEVRGAGGRTGRERLAGELLESVGLEPDFLAAWPGELSGGEQKRVALARALAVSPKLLVLDEALAELDVIAQARMVRLLTELRLRREMAILFITHDLSLAAAVAGEILVMDRGRMVDRGRAADVIARPAHAVTRRLVEARPGPLPGEVRGPV